MRVAKLIIPVLCMVVVFETDVSRAEALHNYATPDRLFDQYGRIRWEDEQPRLDNFAIQLTNEPDSIGYIFVNDGKDMCPGEAQARAMRAKRYIVEHRGVPWDRAIWKSEGYTGEFLTTLQPIPRGVPIDYPVLRYARVSPEVHVKEKCQLRIAQIKKSKWN